MRGMGAWGIILGNHMTSVDVGDWLFEYLNTAKTLAAGQLVFLGVVVSIVVGI